MKNRETLRCPQCQKVPMTCTEVVCATTVFDVKADGTLAAEGYHGAGETMRLEAECSCGHAWRVRTNKALALLSEKGTNQ